MRASSWNKGSNESPKYLQHDRHKVERYENVCINKKVTFSNRPQGKDHHDDLVFG